MCLNRLETLYRMLETCDMLWTWPHITPEQHMYVKKTRHRNMKGCHGFSINICFFAKHKMWHMPCAMSGKRTKRKHDGHQKLRAMWKMTPYECTYCMECHWDMCHDTTTQAHAVKNTSHVFQTTWKTYGNLCDATKHVCHVFHVHMCVKGGHGMSKKHALCVAGVSKQ